MGVVHHAPYFVWFEAARSEFCRKFGVDYRQMEADVLFMPVVQVQCRYKTAARYDDEVLIRAQVIERTRRTLKMGYSVQRGETLLAEGETVQILIDSQNRPRSFPAEVASRFDGEVD